MKKFHWGHAILIFFILYVSTLIFVLYKSTTVDHSLVVQDYYNQDIKYQEKYDKVKNVTTYGKSIDIKWLQRDQVLQIDFGEDRIRKGQFKLYNPADKLKDVEIEIEDGTSSIYKISDLKLTPGRWKVQIDWSEEGVPFYIEDELYIVQP